MPSVSAFAKRIRDITLDRVFQQNDAWIVMPDNAGAVAGRVNLARNWSRLDAVWKRDARSRWRLSVTDLLHRNDVERSMYSGDPDLAMTVVHRTRTVWRLVWEQSL